MPTYEVTVDGDTYAVESDRDLTDAEATEYALGQRSAEAPVPEPTEQPGLVARYGPTAIRAVGGAAAGIVGAVPGPITTPLALVIGGGTEALAEGGEILTGAREELSYPEIGTEAVISATPLGRFAKAGQGIGRAALRGAGKVAAAEAVGAQARSFARTGEPASIPETLTAGTLGAVFGGAGGALESWLTRVPRAGGAAEEATEKAAEAAPLPPLGQRRIILPEEVDAVPPTRPVTIFGPDGKVVDEAAPILEARPTLEVQRALRDDVVQNADAAAQAIGQLEPEVRKQRFFRQLSGSIKEGLFDPVETSRVLRRGGYTMEDFFATEVEPMFTTWERDVSEAGKKLNLVSQEKRAVVASMRRDPKLRELVDAYAIAKKEANGDSFLGRLWQEALDFDDASRVAVIGQMATAHRNFISQFGRLLLEPPTDLVKNVLPSRFGGTRGNPLATLYGIVSAATPGDTTRVMKILERIGPEGDVLAQELFGRSSAEGGVSAAARPIRGLPARMVGTFREGIRERRVMKTIFGPIADAAGAYNSLSESFGRRAAFQARLMQRAEARGLSWADVVENPKLLSYEDFTDANKHALDVTFAASPETVLGKRFVNIVRQTGPLGSLFITFPRYMVNAGKFLMDFNPAGALRLLDQTKLEQRGADIAGRAVVGTALLGAAYLFRASRYAGEKWYEGAPDGREGEERTNLLGLAGPAIPYFALGEMMYRQIHGDEGRPPFTPGDLVQGSLGLRLSPAAQAALEAMGGANSEEGWAKWQKAAEKSVGEYVARFTVPLRTVKDFAAQYGDDSEAVYYDPREVVEFGKRRTTMANPTIQNVPELGEALGRPAAVSPLTGREKRGEFTALRQLTGLTKMTRTAIEKEFAALGLSEYDTFKPTGYPKADRELSRRIGAIADELTPQLIASEEYQAMGPAERKGVWDEFFKQASKEARADLKETNPAVAEVLSEARSLPRKQRAILKETEGLDVDEILYQAMKEAPEGWFVQPGLSEVAPRGPEEGEEREEPQARRDARALVVDAATEIGLDPMLALAVAEQESRFNPAAKSPAGALGLMQLMPGTAKELGVEDPLDAEQSARGGTLYLKQLLDQFKSIPLALAAYNAGPARVAKLGRVPNIKETRDYVRQVQERMQRFAEEAR